MASSAQEGWSENCLRLLACTKEVVARVAPNSVGGCKQGWWRGAGEAEA